MAVLCDVQHRRVAFRSVPRLSLVGSWSPPSTYQGSGVRQSYGVREAFWQPCPVARRLLPPPFPTSAFVISAGATRYRFIAFVLSFGVGRACRFALLAFSRLCLAGDPWRGRGRPTLCSF